MTSSIWLEILLKILKLMMRHTDTDNQELVFSETFDLEYGGIYSNSEGSDSDFFTDSEL